MMLVRVITRWKWKNQNKNYVKSFDATTNAVDNVDEDSDSNDDMNNEHLDAINSDNNNMNKTKDEIIKML